LLENILAEGFIDPVYIRVGYKNKKFRLESGNHRVPILHANGIEFAPAIVQIQETCVPDAENIVTDANHNFDLPNTVDTPGLTYGYAKPKTIFTELFGQANHSDVILHHTL
jgi:hypothetical protein